jgi:hypothetical protein
VIIKTEVNLAERTVRLKLIPDTTVINTEMMTVQAMINQIDKESVTRQIEQKEGKWELDIEAPAKDESKIINFSIMAKTVQGNSISPNIRPVVINDELFSKVESTKPNPIDDKKIAETENDSKGEEEGIAEEIDEEEEGVDWVKTTAIVVAINIIFMIAGFFLYKFLKKRSAEKQTQLLDRLS